MTRFDSLVSRLESVRKSGDGFTARCPAHDDHENSLSIKAGDDGRILLHCFAGCTLEAITAALDLEVRDLFPSTATHRERPARRAPITVDDLARHKELPAEFLRSLGLRDREDGVLIPYFNQDGSPASRNRLRTALTATEGSLWLFGKGKPVPYGEDRLDNGRHAGYSVLVEGESDCWTLWHHDIPALGLPGATHTSKIQPEHVKEIPKLYIIDEGSKGGEQFVRGMANQLAKLNWKGTAFRVTLDGAKDPNELHRQKPETFKEKFEAALEQAKPLKIEKSPVREPASDSDIVELFQNVGLTTINSSSAPKDIETALRGLGSQLRDADDLRRMVVRRAAVDHLTAVGIQGAGKLVDAALKSTADKNEDSAGSTVLMEEPEPWPQAVDGAEVLDTVVRTISRFVVLPAPAAVAIALWILHSYAFSAFFVSPILAITSPDKRCGKTTLLEVIGALATRVLLASNITVAALFRSIEKFQPTFLVDEADTFLANSDEMRGVINASHYRSTAHVIRTVGDDNEPRIFSTWCPKGISLIGKLKGTLVDRSIHIPMRRRAPGEEVERLRRDRIYEDLGDCRKKLARWVADHTEAIKEADPDPVSGLNDRAEDNWRPLLALAEVAGGDWPARAREAARAIEGGADEGDSAPAIQLLEDIREIFQNQGQEILGSDELVKFLVALEDRPWGEWRRGKPLSKHGLSRLVKPFGVVPAQTHRRGEKIRGYRLQDFEDVFLRYLPTESGQRDTINGINNLDEFPSRDALGTAPSQVGAAREQQANCPDLESGCPDPIPGRLPFESGQEHSRCTCYDREEFDL